MAYYYRGVGKVYLGPYSGTSALRYVANVSELMISFNSKEEALQDYDSVAGGQVMAISQVEKAEISMTLNDLSPENLAVALWGESSDITGSTSATTETLVSYKGGLIELEYASPTVSLVTDSLVSVTYALGTDYTVSGAGLVIPSTSTITNGSQVKINYQYPDQTAMECLTGGATEFKIVLDGINIANSNKPVKVTLHKVKFNPSKDINFKGDKFAELKLTGNLLKDDTITTSGKSQYFKEVVIL